MTSINEMNAIIKDRARIREGIVSVTKEQTLYVDTDTSDSIRQIRLNNKVFVDRGYILSLLSDNIIKSD